MTTHARLSASGASYWSKCPARPWLSELHGDNSTNEAAEFGTAVHGLAENRAALESVEPGDVSVNGLPVTEDMVKMAKEYWYWLDFMIETFMVETYQLEAKVPLHPVTAEDGATGTADFIGLSHDGKTLVVADLKTGSVGVSAHDNSQLAMYALGAVSLLGVQDTVESVVVAIIQPAKRDTDDGDNTRFSYETLSRDDLVQWNERLTTAANNAWAAFNDLEGLLRGDHCAPSQEACKWCPAIHKCPAIKSSVDNLFDNVKVDDLNDAELLHYWKMIPVYRKYLDEMDAYVDKRMRTGSPVAGLKLVTGRVGNRTWGVPEKQVVAALTSKGLKHNDIYKMTVVSPTELEKHHADVYGAVSADLVTQKPGKPTVVLESDKRPAIVLDTAFEPID